MAHGSWKKGNQCRHRWHHVQSEWGERMKREVKVGIADTMFKANGASE